MQIESVQEYLTLIEKLKNNYTYTERSTYRILGEKTYIPHFIFRGHADHEYELLPSVLRWKRNSQGDLVGEYSNMESNILNDFVSHACRYIPNISVDDYEAWLEIAQHFGVPTRLLDFSENPLIALYFACCEQLEKDASIWIVNEPAYNKKFFSISETVSASTSQQNIMSVVINEIIYQDFQPHEDDKVHVRYPWIYMPNHREERMSLQSSVFMLWGADRRSLTAFITDDECMKEEDVTNQDKGILGEIIVPARYKRKLLNQLEAVGISEKAIYPGLDGVGKFIKRKYSNHIE